MATAKAGRRHVWVDCSGGYQYPGLLMGWRRDPRGCWEAQVAVVHPASVLVQWHPAAALHPVTDDRWAHTRPSR